MNTDLEPYPKGTDSGVQWLRWNPTDIAAPENGMEELRGEIIWEAGHDS